MRAAFPLRPTDMILSTIESDNAIALTKVWLDKAVIGLNLCPFAKSVQVKNQIRFAVSDATDAETLLLDLACELQLLASTDPEQIDTTLLIHPTALTDFLDFNDFLDLADAVIDELDLGGVLQIASLHPDYQFAGTAQDDIENHTNRSPFPTLHLLRESSIERAVAAFPDASEIYQKNIATMRRIGHAGWKALGVATKPRSNEPEDEK